MSRSRTENFSCNAITPTPVSSVTKAHNCIHRSRRNGRSSSMKLNRWGSLTSTRGRRSRRHSLYAGWDSCLLRPAPRLLEGKGNRDASPHPQIKCRIQKDLGHQAGADGGLAEGAKRALDAEKDAIPNRF